MDEKAKKDRSPQFPFIPLGKAVERARSFEAEYQRHEARMANAVKIWSYAEKSSGGIQTVAALCSYGLMDDSGTGADRKLKISDLGMRILKESRPEKKNEAIKAAALKPKIIAEMWGLWGKSRPPDAECISSLHLDRGFTEDAARRFLGVYDGTIRFAELSDSDKINNASETKQEKPFVQEEDKSRQPPPPKPKVDLMMGERVVFSQELRPDQGFRIIVSGDVDDIMLDALRTFADFQKKILGAKRTDNEGKGPAENK